MVDAGSSGSRVYLYNWVCYDNSEHNLSLKSNLEITGSLLPDVKPMVNHTTNEFLGKKVEPGLSEQAPEKAFGYIKELLDYAADNIPSDSHNVTSLYILGTAGMRLLPQNKQTAIYDALKVEIRQNYPYEWNDDDIETISGQDEALYRWVALNYALGNIQEPANGNTVASADMGGASMQLAFQINTQEEKILKQSQSVSEPSIETNVTLGNRTYQMFLASWLGYGGNTAFDRWDIEICHSERAFKFLSTSKWFEISNK